MSCEIRSVEGDLGDTYTHISHKVLGEVSHVEQSYVSEISTISRLTIWNSMVRMLSTLRMCVESSLPGKCIRAEIRTYMAKREILALLRKGSAVIS